MPIKVILDNGENPLLSNLSADVFRSICTGLNKNSRIMWITYGSDPASYRDPRRHLINGFARSAQAENDGLRLVTVDIQQSLEATDSIVPEILMNIIRSVFLLGDDASEREFIVRDNSVVVPRLLPTNHLNKWISQTPQASKIEQARFRARPLVMLDDTMVGATSHVFSNDQAHREPLADGDIEIEVHAIHAPNNISDSTNYEYSGRVASLGSSVAGLQNGDRVIATSTSKFASWLRVPASHVCKVSDEIPFTTAAALPSALMATQCVFSSLLKSFPPKRILLQGISNVTIQVMLKFLQQHSGDVLVLATTPSESSLLKTLGLSEDQILEPGQYSSASSSRRSNSLQKLDAIITLDISKIPSSMTASLKPFRTIVQLQTAGSSSRRQLQLPSNVTMHMFDIDAYLSAYPEERQSLLEGAANIAATCASQLLQLPVSSKPIEHVSEASGSLESSVTLTTTVFEVDDNAMVPTMKPTIGDYELDHNATYVISGGLGDLGQQLLVKLAKHGAKHLVSLSRRPAKGDALQQLISKSSKDCKVHHVQCDIAKSGDVEAAVAEIAARGCPPVRGVIQSAHTLQVRYLVEFEAIQIILTAIQDRSIASMTLEDFNLPLEPKLKGTLNLQKAFDTPALEFFIMLSSAANIVGTRGQSNYNAGNAVQDALAQAAKHKTCHYLSLSPSMVEGTSAVQNTDIRKALQRSGLDAIQETDMDAIFEYILSPTARVERIAHIAAGFTPESISHAETANGTVRSPFFTHVLGSRRTETKQARPQLTRTKTFKEILDGGSADDALTYATATVTKKLSSLTYVDAQSMELDKPIADFGLDSLIAIELRNWIKREFGAALQSLEILNERGINKLAERIVNKVAANGALKA